jgi:oligo-1,6-glucosidase
MMIHFDIHMLGCGPLGKFDFRKLYRWNVLQLKEVITNWQTDMQQNNYWMANYLSNHDQPRHVSRFGDDKKYWAESAKAFALLNFTLRGTPIMYQGEEIGMTNATFDMEELKDFESKNAYKVLQSMMHLPAFLAKKVVLKMTRDHARTPMQWNNSNNAGFSSIKPWIKVNENYKDINVNTQENDSKSILSFYKKLIAFVKESEIQTFKVFETTHQKHKQIFSYYRKDDNKDVYYIIINLTNKIATFKHVEHTTKSTLILSNYQTFPELGKKMILRPFEALIIRRGDHDES